MKCDELKAHYFLTPDEVAVDNWSQIAKTTALQYYLKSEADKVIEELKEKHKTEVKELLCLIRDKENNFNRAFDSEEKEIRHNKYKRCLAMAKWCVDRYDNAFERVLSVRDMGFEPSDELTFDLAFFRKWRHRWLELAEKFKEAK